MKHLTPALSLLMVVPPEPAPFSAETLDTLAWADEVVLVHQGFDEAFLTLLETQLDSKKCHCFFHPSQDPVVLQQFALDQARGQWILWLKPNEWASPELRQKIEGLRDYQSSCHGIGIPVQSYWQGYPLHGKQRHELRLFQKEAAQVSDTDSTEGYQVSGPQDTWQEFLRQEHCLSLPHLFKALNQNSTQAAYHALETRQAGGTLGHFTLKPLGILFQQLIFQGRLLDGPAGIMAAASQAFETALTQMKYRTLLQEHRTEKSLG